MRRCSASTVLQQDVAMSSLHRSPDSCPNPQRPLSPMSTRLKNFSTLWMPHTHRKTPGSHLADFAPSALRRRPAPQRGPSLHHSGCGYLNSLLIIHETKFYKTRLVPIGPRLTAVLSTYSKKRQQLGHSQSLRAPFFVTRHGNPVTRQMAELAFVRRRERAGVRRQDGSRYQPRLHDLRHAFTVHRLVSWYRQGADVQRLLPQLSTYLGHIHIAATQRYLTMTPELLEEASLRFEHYALGGSHHG